MTSDGLVLVFFVSYRHGRNSGAICCWKYELMPTYLEIRVLIGHVRSFRHRNNRFIICSWRCIGFVLFVPFIVQGFKFIEQTFGPEKGKKIIYIYFFFTNGQLISKCPLGVIVSTKIPTKKFDNFCPGIWKVVNS